MDKNEQQPEAQPQAAAPRTTLPADRATGGWARDVVAVPAEAPRTPRGRKRADGTEDTDHQAGSGKADGSDTLVSQTGTWAPSPEVVDRRYGALQGRSGDQASTDWAREGGAAQATGADDMPANRVASGGGVGQWLSGASGIGSLLAGGALLAGVAGGGSSTAATPAATVAATRTLVVHDGLISGATVYVDSNGNGKPDASEKIGVTDANGKLVLPADLPAGNLLVVGGTNVDTGLPNTMTLALASGAAGSGNLVVSPLTTLVLAVQGTAAAKGTSMTLAAAEAAVKQALGLPTSVDLSTYDPFAAGNADSPTALALQKASAQLATLASATALTSVADTFGALAGAVVVGGSTKINLADAGQLQAIFGLPAAQLGELQDLAQANQAIASASSAGGVASAQAASTTPAIVGLAHDTGSSATDKVTADPALVITGRNDGAVLQLSTDGGKTWVAADAFAPADGALQVVARLSYGNGFASASSAPFSFTLDTRVPVQPGLTLAHDTGVSATDHITSDASLQLSGADTSARLEYSSDQVSWSTSLPAPHEGDNTVYVRQSYPLNGAISATGKISFTLDTAAQAGTAGLAANTVDDTSDTGVVGDNITSVVRPLLTGQTEAGAQEVRVTIDGHTTVINGSALNAKGGWSLRPDHDLAEGSHAITVDVLDAAGNHSGPVVVGTVTVDTTAPSVGTAHLSSASDSGLSPDDGITNVTRPTIEGLAEPFASVQVDIDGTTYATTAGSDGKWSVVVTQALDAGDYTPSVTLIDRAGNAAEPFDGDSFTVMAPPTEAVRAGLARDEAVDTGISSEDGITQVQTPTLAGALDQAGVVVTVKFAGKTYVTLTQDDGTWSIQLPDSVVLDDGTYIPAVTYTDDAGNVVRTTGTPVVIDTTPPDEATAELVHTAANDTGSDATDNITANSSPLIQGTSEPYALITVDLNGTTFDTQADAKGHWQVKAEGLDDGDYTPKITVTDLAGNASDPIEGTPFTIDTQGPEAATGSLVHDDVNDTGIDANDSITANSKPSFSGTAEADAMVTLTIAGLHFSATADSDGHWQIDPDKAIPDGTWTPVVSVQDVAGNVTASELDPVTIDTVAPSARSVSGGLTADEDNDTGASSTDGLTANKTPTLSGKSDALALIHVEVDGNGYDTQADEDGNWSVQLETLDDGTYTPVITVVDAAGNESAPIKGTPFTIDTTPPDDATAELVHTAANDTGSDATDNITANSSPLIQGTSEPYALITVDLNGTTFDTQADAKGHWQVKAEGLDDGDYTPKITVTDLAGNPSDPIEGTPFTIDTQGPEAATGSLVHDDVNDTGIDANDSITANSKPSFSGTAEADAMVTLTIGGLHFSATADGDGHWQIDPDKAIPDGTWTPVVSVQDAAGNVTSAELDPVTIDTVAPSARSVSGGLTANADNDTGASASDGVTNVAGPELSGKADPLAQIHVEVDGNAYDVQADDTGSWAVTLDTLADGTYTPVITVVDAAGNESLPIKGLPFTIDTTPPADPTGGLRADAANDTGSSSTDNITRNSQPVLEGTAEAGANVQVELGTLTLNTVAGKDGHWSIKLPTPLADGEYTPVVTVTDKAGNSTDGVELRSVVIDTVIDKPVGGLTHDEVSDTGADSTDGITSNRQPSFSGTAEALARIQIQVAGQTLNTTADADGAWSVDLSAPLADGTYKAQITATDLAGNTASTLSDAFTVITRISLPGGDVGQHQVAVVGKPIDLAVVPPGMSSQSTVSDDSGNLASGLAIDDATQHVKGTATAAGTTWLAVNATDLAGNEATQYLQLATVASVKNLNLSANTINSPDAEKASLYLGTDAAQTFNIYSSNGDVLLAGGGNDLIRLYYKPASYGFARIDGGDGIDQLFLAGTGIDIDFSEFNNPQGNGQVIERVESFFFSGTDSTVHITANDLLHMRSDLLDVDGKHQVVRFLSNAGNKGTVDVEGLTQVGATGAWGASGAVSSGASNDKFTKLVGVVNDGSTDHLVELLVQNGLTVHTA